MQDRFKFRIFCKSENKMMLFNNPTLIDGDILKGGLLFKNYDHKIKNVHEVKSEDLILMQCTGLKDKNGKLVFEGDILGGIYENLYINWCNKCKQFQLKAQDYGCMACEGDIHWADAVEDNNKLEVIGNIYQDEELLNGNNP